MNSVDSLQYFIPELVVVGTALLTIIYDLLPDSKHNNSTAYIALGGIALTLIAIFATGAPSESLFDGMIRIDGFSIYFKVIALAATAVTIVFSIQSREIDPNTKGEYYSILIAVNLGLFMMASSTNLLMAYLSLEMVSISSYILAGFLTHNQRSSEASFKYIIYGAVASGTMLFGLSLIFGLTGTASMPEIGGKLARLIEDQDSRLAVMVAVVFILTGLGYKIASVPFHMWSPDVYEGAPIPITAFLSVASKAAGFALFIRIFYLGFGQITNLSATNWTLLLSIISALTMTFGNLAALPQENVKRLLAYSSIAHSGYLLMGAVLLNDTGVKAILFYLTIYLFMNLGAFFVVILVANQVGSEMISGYRNLVSRAPLLAISMAIFLFSLVGLPPLAGFAGKWILFTAALQEHLYWLVVVAALNSAVSLYYYVRIVKAMFFETAEDQTPLTFSFGNQLLLLVFVIPTILLFILWEPSYEVINAVIKDFTPTDVGKLAAVVSQQP